MRRWAPSIETQDIQRCWQVQPDAALSLEGLHREVEQPPVEDYSLGAIPRERILR